MGADGSIVICKRADFEAANPGVPPSWLHLYEGTVLGVEAVWGYQGDNLYGSNYLSTSKHDNYPLDSARLFEDGEFRAPTPKEFERLKQAVEWFERNAEDHEVWT